MAQHSLVLNNESVESLNHVGFRVKICTFAAVFGSTVNL
jgi:hypothetical protein